jgi:DNA-binding SARP family transcriptional activator
MVACEDLVATPTAPKPRSILAVLLLHADQTVPVGALIQELWGERAPASAMTTLQTYVLQLRKLLGGALSMPLAQVADKVLLTVPGGYQFRCASAEFDLRTYDRLAIAGRRALAGADNALAAELLVRARDLWRGPPLADVHAGPLLAPEIKRLGESRLTTVEHAIEARLRLGRHHELLPELTGMVTQHRLHENLNAQFMVALHRSGRRQEALQVFDRLRLAMREELGLEPSRRLRALQRAVLKDDPALEVQPRADGLAQLLDQIPAR